MITRTIACVSIVLIAGCGDSFNGDSPRAPASTMLELHRLTTLCSDAVEQSSCGIGKPRLLRLLPDTSVLLVDGQADVVRLFGDGKRSRVGRTGDGPGEFRFVADLSLSSDSTVDVLDARHFRIEQFTLPGQLLQTRPVAIPATTTDLRLGRGAFATLELSPGRALGAPVDGRMRVTTYGGDSSSRTFSFTGHAVQLLGTEFRPAFVPFRPSVHWAVSPSGRASYSYGAEPWIRLLPQGDSLALSWSPIEVTPSERDSAVNQLINPGGRRSQATSYNNRARSLVDSIPTKHEIAVEHFFDDSDRLWVQRGGNTAGERELQLVDSAGVRLARTLILPARTVAWTVRGSLVAIYRLDETDGGAIEVYRASVLAGERDSTRNRRN